MTAHAVAVVGTEIASLPALIDRAVGALANARTAAEVLEARDMAGLAYDAAKRAARLGRAKQAHDDLIAAAYRAQADALVIEAQAKRRLADEYDAAQLRGEVAKASVRTDIVPNGNDVRPATAADLGISRKEIHEARIVRDAEAASPGIVRRALDQVIERGEEPTRAKVHRTIKPKASRRPRGHQFKVVETQHDRDLRMLMGVWEAACPSARREFLETVERSG